LTSDYSDIRVKTLTRYSFGILGGGNLPPLGTFTEYLVVERDQVILSPAHLDDVQMSAWPLGGVTAWR
jgi:NADPH:quinone reductase-like Zn-dependent oxidoreductase